MAVPNAVLTFLIATSLQQPKPDDFNDDGTSFASETEATAKAAQTIMASFTVVMVFILYNRSRTSYNRWWEGGTLLQKTRGEWFNAFSSIMAFTSTKPELQKEVESYTHLLSRLMSLLMCCGLQQVSPNRDRPFEIIDLEGIEPESMEFLNSAPDKVEVILQWIQRSMILHTQSGVLPVAPPILSRAFQEVSRGIVNLQNARKIADFPYPYPLAQVSMILQLLHWAMMPVASSLALPRAWAVVFAFSSIFVLWCIHFNALDLEFPFGARVNDLPMNAFQQDWNKSVLTLLDKRATRPPDFKYDPQVHSELDIVMSDASPLYVPKVPPPLDKGIAVIKVADRKMGELPETHRRLLARMQTFHTKPSLARSESTTPTSKAPITIVKSNPQSSQEQSASSSDKSSRPQQKGPFDGLGSAPTLTLESNNVVEPRQEQSLASTKSGMPTIKEGPDIPQNDAILAIGSAQGTVYNVLDQHQSVPEHSKSLAPHPGDMCSATQHGRKGGPDIPEKDATPGSSLDSVVSSNQALKNRSSGALVQPPVIEPLRLDTKESAPIFL